MNDSKSVVISKLVLNRAVLSTDHTSNMVQVLKYLLCFPNYMVFIVDMHEIGILD